MRKEGFMKKSLAFTIIAVGLALAGCPTASIPYDRASAGNVTNIGLITPVFPDDATVVLASSVGQSFGLIGALADAAMQSGRDSTFNEILNERQFQTREAFLERVTAQLEQQDYEVTAIEIDRNGNDFLDEYDSEEPVDAYLDIVVSRYGYTAAGIGDSTPYRPSFYLKAKLTRASDNAVLMQDTVAYNPYGPYEDAVSIAPDPNYEFIDFDALEAQPDDAVEGLEDATNRTADALSGLMR
jgi:hypothetical protein